MEFSSTMSETESLFVAAMKEAEAFKWVESQKAGRDLGSQAIVVWFKTKWHSWYRDAWVDHLCGKRYWAEFGDQDFDFVHKNTLPNHDLSVRIVNFLTQHRNNISENLGIILWAVEEHQDVCQVLSILKAIDINKKRIDLDQMIDSSMGEAERCKWLDSEREKHDLGDKAIQEWFHSKWPSWVKDFIKKFNP